MKKFLSFTLVFLVIFSFSDNDALAKSRRTKSHSNSAVQELKKSVSEFKKIIPTLKDDGTITLTDIKYKNNVVTIYATYDGPALQTIINQDVEAYRKALITSFSSHKSWNYFAQQILNAKATLVFSCYSTYSQQTYNITFSRKHLKQIASPSNNDPETILKNFTESQKTALPMHVDIGCEWEDVVLTKQDVIFVYRYDESVSSLISEYFGPEADSRVAELKKSQSTLIMESGLINSLHIITDTHRGLKYRYYVGEKYFEINFPYSELKKMQK